MMKRAAAADQVKIINQFRRIISENTNRFYEITETVVKRHRERREEDKARDKEREREREQQVARFAITFGFDLKSELTFANIIKSVKERKGEKKKGSWRKRGSQTIGCCCMATKMRLTQIRIRNFNYDFVQKCVSQRTRSVYSLL